jgi:hypothetical protein
MRNFWLNRTKDISGVSGTGIVAEGTQYSNGWCALTWISKHTSGAWYASIDDLREIHGHNGATEIIWETKEYRISEPGIYVFDKDGPIKVAD